MRVLQLSAPALLSVAFVTAASGATVMYSANYGPTAVPFPSSTVTNLPLFNPALGTLTKVTLELDANVSSGTISWDNEAPVESDVTLGIGAEVTASAMAGLAAVAIPLQTGSGMVDADNDGAADFLSSDAFSVTGGSGSDSDSVSSMLGATLAAYTGLGTFPVDMSAGTETFLSTSGGYGPIDPIPGMTDGTVKVIYEYDPVPAPGAIGLLALGAAPLARRRRA